ncbi:MAG TPA: sulfatase [Myxococcota bacterium]|nr:sulfatase [Myxococcota bacterium]
MLARPLAALAIALLVAPCAIAFAGGADLDLVAGLRVSWFERAGLAIALATALAAWLLQTKGGLAWQIAATLAAFQCLVVALVAWGGGFEVGTLSVRHAIAPALIGTGLLAVAWLRGVRLAGRPTPLASVLRIVLPPAVGALLLGAALRADRADLERRMAAERPARRGSDVIFVLADTLRADALGAYGAKPSPSPFLDELAAGAVRFELAIAQAPWTLPSVWSLMTSLHPSTLDPESRGAANRRALGLRPDARVARLAAQLRASGWHTAGFQKNPLLSPGSGLELGFDVYESVGGDRAELHSAGQLVSAALHWAETFADVRRRGMASPFFLYVHFMDPHINYQPPPSFVPPEARDYDGPVDGSARSIHALLKQPGGPRPSDVAQMRALYRGEVTYLDAQLRRLFDNLRDLGLWTDRTLVVFVADHGEQFGEHGGYEHGDVYAENVHVPLWLRGAGLEPRSVPDVVRIVDVAPTVLDLLGVAGLPAAEGRSLAALLQGLPLDPVAAITEYGARVRVTDRRFSLVRSSDGAQLFDVSVDPGEKTDLAGALPAQVAALEGALAAHDAHERRFPADGVLLGRTLDPETREALEEMGYLRRGDEE